MIAYYSASDIVHRSGLPTFTQQDVDDIHNIEKKMDRLDAELATHNH